MVCGVVLAFCRAPPEEEVVWTINLSIYQYINLAIYQYINLTIYQSIYLSITLPNLGQAVYVYVLLALGVLCPYLLDCVCTLLALVTVIV